MNSEELKRRLDRRSFRPFRLHLSDGTKYDIRRPEMMYVLRSEAMVARHMGKNKIFEDAVLCSLLHATSVELLNGRSKGRKKKQ